MRWETPVSWRLRVMDSAMRSAWAVEPRMMTPRAMMARGWSSEEAKASTTTGISKAPGTRTTRSFRSGASLARVAEADSTRASVKRAL
jgi:hypothetical protein